jgi:hypothetical protein
MAMLKRRHRLMGLAFLGTAFLAIVACEVGPPEDSAGETTTIADHHVNVTETESTMSAVVTDPNGAVVYTYEGVILIKGVPAVKCELLSNGAKGYHLFPLYPSSTLPSKAEFAQLAYYDYIATAGAYSGEDTFDSQGCDGAGFLTCTSAGGCCDTHDACYAANGCNASSWILKNAMALVNPSLLMDPCAQCNANALGCVAGSAIGNGPGPATCCSTPDPSSPSSNTCGHGWGEAGDEDAECLCPPKSESATPVACTSSVCTGKDGGAGDGGNKDGGGGEGGRGEGGGGDGGAAGEEGGGYAAIEPARPERHHPMRLVTGASVTIPFSWKDASGIAPASDLWIEAGGRPVLQVLSIDDRPFVRAGFDVASLEPDTPYLLEIERTTDIVSFEVVQPSGELIVDGQFKTSASDAAPLDVVLPSTFWRTAIVADFT